MRMDKVRRRIREAIEARGLTLSDVSKKLGRNHAYMQQFLERGIPATLKEIDRHKLSQLLDIPQAALGGPKNLEPVVATERMRMVPEFDVRVAAGGGSLNDAENVRSQWPFNAEYLHDELRLASNNLAIVEVRGDSMEPTLSSGDRVLINGNDVQISQPGIFVLFDGGGTVIKRVEHIPGSLPARLVLISDNSAHSRYEVDADAITVIGRVVWAARRL